MRLVRLRAPGGLENLKLVEEDHPKPRPGELLVRIRASSLNFHDDMVVLGRIPCADGRIPMSDGTVINYKAVPDWGQKASVGIAAALWKRPRRFPAYQGKPADWYLRLTAEGTKVLTHERPNSPNIPISP